jgi:hypothetical protein
MGDWTTWIDWPVTNITSCTLASSLTEGADNERKAAFIFRVYVRSEYMKRMKRRAKRRQRTGEPKSEEILHSHQSHDGISDGNNDDDSYDTSGYTILEEIRRFEISLSHVIFDVNAIITLKQALVNLTAMLKTSETYACKFGLDETRIEIFVSMKGNVSKTVGKTHNPEIGNPIPAEQMSAVARINNLG